MLTFASQPSSWIKNVLAVFFSNHWLAFYCARKGKKFKLHLNARHMLQQPLAIYLAHLFVETFRTSVIHKQFIKLNGFYEIWRILFSFQRISTLRSEEFSLCATLLREQVFSSLKARVVEPMMLKIETKYNELRYGMRWDERKYGSSKKFRYKERIDNILATFARCGFEHCEQKKRNHFQSIEINSI